MFYNTLKKLSKNGERLTLIIAGNHDNPERLVAAGPLAMEHGIIMVGTPKTVVSCGEYGNHKVKQNYREDTINLAVSHLFAMGSEEGGSERSIQFGGSYIINGSYLPKEAQYIALGHVHKPQVVPGTNKRARYSGSPLHYNKKEIMFYY